MKKDNQTGGLFSQRIKRRFRFGTNMIAFAALAIVLFVVVNMVLERFSTKLTADLTSEKLFTIGDVTREHMNALEKDVEIIALYDRVKGEANTDRVAVIKVLDLYDAFSRIDVSYVDPDANPNFILDTVGRANAGSYQAGDYIVKCGDKTRRIAASEMYVTTNQAYGFLSVPVRTGMQAERKLTTAVMYVTADVSPIVYFASGHGEEDIDGFSEVVTYIEGLGCDVLELDTTIIGSMPEDAAVIVYMGPKYDITSNEKTMIQQWLEQKGGQIAVCVDPLQTGNEFPNLNKLLGDMFALSLNNDRLSDDDSSNLIASVGSNDYFLGVSVSNGPIEKSAVYRVPVFSSRSVNVLNVDETASGINHYPIIQTMGTAYSTGIVGGAKSSPGVFTAAAAAKNLNFSEVVRAVVFGSTKTLSDDYYNSFGNYTRYTMSIFAMSIDWMIGSYGDNPGLEVATKNYGSTQLITTQSQTTALAVIAIIVIPLIIIAIGVIVWIRRRHL